ncbi:MAG TPA: cytidine deaminase [Chitinophagaceae bacterium]
MVKEELKFTMEVYDSSDELNEDDAFLLSEARSVTQFAYAPYSNFQVGAVAKLVNGKIVSGTNQENASYPAGICAERSLLSTAASIHPGIGIETMAVTYNNLKGESDSPVSPCGICRQVISEFQNRYKKPIRIILSGMKGKVQIIDNACYLLPLAFSSEDMK